MVGDDTKRPNQSAPPPISITVERGRAASIHFTFSEPFRIGRDKASQLQLPDGTVSRFHAEVYFAKDRWWIRDLQSANGTYIDNVKIECQPLESETRIEFGRNGPLLSFSIQEIAKAPEAKPDLTATTTDVHTMNHYVEHYFSKSDEEDIGLHTFMIRRAFQQMQRNQKWKYSKIIAVAVILLIILGVYAFQQYRQTEKTKKLAESIFYTMKSLELRLASLETMIEATGDARAMEQLKKYRAEHQEMEKSYDRFIEELDVYSKGMSDEDRIIFRIARTFGECEVNIPRGFVREVKNYIGKWQSSGRLARAVDLAVRNRYNIKISKILREHNLPPQFFYLAVQESNLDTNACGPETRYGIAKGMWQFIPPTGAQYGLHVGPLAHLRTPDPRDERQHFEKATVAAAGYLRDLYKTEAQASGLLVMASYNWGQGNVRELIKQMPENPRERNFWQLLQKFKPRIPKETYDYVFYIVSAAVIGENPRLFGFDMENPLSGTMME
jgi:membrane-bound lytic murein transglycosylase D